LTEYEPLLPVFFLIEHHPVAEQRFLAEKICFKSHHILFLEHTIGYCEPKNDGDGEENQSFGQGEGEGGPTGRIGYGQQNKSQEDHLRL